MYTKKIVICFLSAALTVACTPKKSSPTQSNAKAVDVEEVTLSGGLYKRVDEDKIILVDVMGMSNPPTPGAALATFEGEDVATLLPYFDAMNNNNQPPSVMWSESGVKVRVSKQGDSTKLLEVLSKKPDVKQGETTELRGFVIYYPKEKKFFMSDALASSVPPRPGSQLAVFKGERNLEKMAPFLDGSADSTDQRWTDNRVVVKFRNTREGPALLEVTKAE